MKQFDILVAGARLRGRGEHSFDAIEPKLSGESDLPIGRFLGKGGLEHWAKVRRQAEAKFGADKMDELFPERAYQLTHNALFPHDCVHVENMGGEIDAPELQNRRLTIGAFPWKFKGGEAAFCRAVAFLDD